MFSWSTSLFNFRHNNFSHLWIYSSQISGFPGDSIRIHGSIGEGNSVTIRLWNYPDSSKAEWQKTVAAGFSGIDFNSSDSGAGFPEIAVIATGQIRPGWKIIEAKSGDLVSRCSYFLRSREPGKRVLYSFPVYTWSAYNCWGGQSLYTANRSTAVNLVRPCPLSDPYLEPSVANYPFFYHAANVDREVIDFLNSEKIEFDVCAESDLNHDDGWMQKYDLIIIGNHSEYWTAGMYTNVSDFLDSGGSVMILSGNTAFWSIIADPETQTISVDKDDHGHHWLQKNTKLTGLFGTHSNLHAMHTYAPYQVKSDTSWILKGSGLQNGDLFGEKSKAHDPLVEYGSFGDKLAFLFGGFREGAASGLEYDVTGPQTPVNWVTVAKGLNPQDFGRGQVYPDPEINWTGEGGADLGYYFHPGGGIVFNAGSITFSPAISLDPAISILLRNVIHKALEMREVKHVN